MDKEVHIADMALSADNNGWAVSLCGLRNVEDTPPPDRIVARMHYSWRPVHVEGVTCQACLLAHMLSTAGEE